MESNFNTVHNSANCKGQPNAAVQSTRGDMEARSLRVIIRPGVLGCRAVFQPSEPWKRPTKQFASHYERQVMKAKSSPPVTAEMAAKIRFLKLTKGLYNHQIASIFGINQGRVSEVMNDKLFPDIPPSQGDLFQED